MPKVPTSGACPRQTSQPHFMTFETPNSHDVKAATVDDNARLAISPAALPTDLPGKSAEHDLNKKDIKESRHSLLSDGSSPEAQPPHNLSTQAAVVLAQEAFQGQLVSAEQDAEEEYRPEQSTNSLLRQNTPPTQQSVSEMSPITPFKTFNLKSASAGVRHTDAGEISTQDLFNAATPFAFSTVKKQNNAVSVSSQRLQSGLKKHSRDPAISPGIALLKGGSAEAQDQLSGTVRSNSTLSAPHESGRQLRSEDSSELQEGQIHDFVDDVDVDVDVNAAIDDAGSFLQSWRLESELPSREKIRSSLVAPVGSQ
ncbi:hypothetical protein K490DRAFT_55631 [Saccharata proteae CBS 121410]|uniref:Uncharacterized protein n=1 Tax=Saccharata proteae CBS 121410 TaxID=1314787 RepID=A0A6A5YDX7_9PEZI|nr:hypothetical protein K490DRAFT_55631 [Saccharata proteae CBS 121410]